MWFVFLKSQFCFRLCEASRPHLTLTPLPSTTDNLQCQGLKEHYLFHSFLVFLHDCPHSRFLFYGWFFFLRECFATPVAV
jgi:hypothetical protein